MYKLGLDIHGVIDKEPELFSELTRIMKSKGCEIHILTGSRITPELKEQLNGYGIVYDYIFSILDYHTETGEDMWQDSKNNWWIDDEIWDGTKSIYCVDNNINLHIDDTKRYGEFFSTPFIHFTIDSNLEIVEEYTKGDEFTNTVIKYLMDMNSKMKSELIKFK